MKNHNEIKSQIIHDLKVGFNMLRQQKERTAQRLGKRLTVDSCAHAYVLYDEMASYLNQAELPEEDLRILSNCPDIYVKALDYFIHHHDVRFEAYAKCIEAILEEEKNKKDAA